MTTAQNIVEKFDSGDIEFVWELFEEIYDTADFLGLIIERTFNDGVHMVTFPDTSYIRISDSDNETAICEAYITEYGDHGFEFIFD